MKKLLARNAAGTLLGAHRGECPPGPGGGVTGGFAGAARWFGPVLGTTPFAPRAALALAPDDFEGRIALYAARAALNLPLFPGVPRG